MKIKVYNKNGNIKITKTMNNGIEQTIFSDLQEGKVAEITIEIANISVQSKKSKLS